MIKILSADDHPVVRTGIRGMIEGQADFEIVAEASNGEEAVQLALNHQPDVVLMDLRMPLIDGIIATKQIRTQAPTVHILILTTFDQDDDIRLALQNGASGYLLKDAPRNELYRAIYATAKGQSAFDPIVASRVVAQLRESQTDDILSEREIAVLRLVSEGKTGKAIGNILHISEATVKSHLRHIYDKLDVPDRASAVTEAIRRKLIHIS